MEAGAVHDLRWDPHSPLRVRPELATVDDQGGPAHDRRHELSVRVPMCRMAPGLDLAVRVRI
jgi:hypothetical protein